MTIMAYDCEVIITEVNQRIHEKIFNHFQDILCPMSWNGRPLAWCPKTNNFVYQFNNVIRTHVYKEVTKTNLTPPKWVQLVISFFNFEAETKTRDQR